MAKTQDQAVQDVQATEIPAEPVVLSFQMSLDNVNALIGILSNRPFAEVAQLISIIRNQALQQLQAMPQSEETTSE